MMQDCQVVGFGVTAVKFIGYTGCGRETGDYKTAIIETLYLQNYKNIILKCTAKLTTF
jgi:hypothetical protein